MVGCAMQTVRFLFESKSLPFPGLPWEFNRSTMQSEPRALGHGARDVQEA